MRRVRIKELADPVQRRALGLAKRNARLESALRSAEKTLKKTAYVRRAMDKASSTKGFKFVARDDQQNRQN
jgi:hypothetical protein